MKNILVKIIALFFLSILLTSSVLNLHVFFHEQDQHHCLATSEDHHDDEDEDTPCDLCLLVLNLNNLDYNNSLEFSYENNIQLINNFRAHSLVYQNQNYDQFFSENQRNKAPPHLI